MKRKIIEIEPELCTGCGDCIPNCPEGALQIIDGKATLVSDLFCDGLGACIGNCPFGAIHITEREAEAYNEKKVMVKIVAQGKNVIMAHLNHLVQHLEFSLYAQALNFLKEHDIDIPDHQTPTENSSIQLTKDDIESISGGCPGLKITNLEKLPHINPNIKIIDKNLNKQSTRQNSELKNFPIQLSLAPIQAHFYKNSDLVIAADCVGFTYPNFHQDFLKNRSLLIGCPKLDNQEEYMDKLTQIFTFNQINSIHLIRMTVPCCGGLKMLIEKALIQAKQVIPIKTTIISNEGEIVSTT